MCVPQVCILDDCWPGVPKSRSICLGTFIVRVALLPSQFPEPVRLLLQLLPGKLAGIDYIVNHGLSPGLLIGQYWHSYHPAIANVELVTQSNWPLNPYSPQSGL
jgi:hypothetical protein